MNYRLQIAFVAILFFIANSAFACSCRNVSVRGSANYSDIVLKGTVLKTYKTINFDSLGVKIEKPESSNSSLNLPEVPMRVALVAVDTVYKGIAGDTITILTPYNEAACGVRFVRRVKYIVYGQNENHVWRHYQLKETEKNKTYFTHLCTSTSEFYQKHEDELIKELSELE